MNKSQFEKILKQGESIDVEFKSWVKVASMKERISLAVNELIAFANAKGGTVYFGVEDNGEVTGCNPPYDIQNMIGAIYDKTRPPLFVEASDFVYEDKRIISLSVKSDGNIYASTDGRCLRRLGKDSKLYYPEGMSPAYTSSQVSDFSSKIIVNSSINDIDKLEIYKLKEKLRTRDENSTLLDLEDMAFLKDLGLIVEENNQIKLTIAGLLFVGKEASIRKQLPQAEVIYLHYDQSNLEEYDSRLDLKQPIITILDRLTEKIQNYNKILNVQIGLFRLEIHDFSEKVFQEALLNALSHRNYEQSGSVYVKHYPDKIVISNPGGFIDGITEKNIITHPSCPRNKLIAETLQRLKYVQRTGQGVDIIFKNMISMGKHFPVYQQFSDSIQLSIYSETEDIEFVKFIIKEQESKQITLSLSELMVLRYVVDNKTIRFKKVIELTQLGELDARACLSKLIRMGLLQTAGNGYMLTERVYDSVKSDVDYTRDKTITYIKAKYLILEYLKKEESISRAKVEELCASTKKRSLAILQDMIDENLIKFVPKGKYSIYALVNKK